MKTRILWISVVLALSFATAANADPLDDYLRGEMTKRRIPGLVLAVVDHGQVVKQAAYGLASVELGVPMREDISFPLASLSKVFTAAAVMKLVEQGRVSLDEPVSRTLTTLPAAWRDVTVRQCLDHSTGLPDILDDSEQARANDRDSLLRKLAELRVEKPGYHAKYNQTGYMLLAMLIEELSGRPFEQFVIETVLKPAGMTATRYADARDIVPRQTTWYTTYVPSADRKYFAFDSGIPVISDSEIFVNLVVYPAFARAGGGLVSTIGDLARFEQGLESGRVLSAGNLRATLTPARLGDGTTNRYSGGWVVIENEGRRLMAFGGANTVAYGRLLDEHVSVIVLTNLQGSDPFSLANEVATRYLKQR